MFVIHRLFIRYNTIYDNDYRSWVVTHFGVGAGGTEISTSGVASVLGPALTDKTLYDPIQIKPSDSNYLDSPRMSINGNVTKSSGSTEVIGSGTNFESQFRVGDKIVVPDAGAATEEMRIISAITSDTVLNVSVAFSNNNTTDGATNGSPERIVPNSCKAIPNNYFTFITNTNYSSYYTTMQLTCVINPLSVADEGSQDELSWLGTDESIKIDEAALYYTNVGGAGTDTRLFAHIAFPPKYVNLSSKLTIERTIIA